jgi:hypothetical protein
MSRRGLTLLFSCVALWLSLLSGCKSAYVAATVTNATAAPVTEIEVDYPSASFGTDTLGAGSSYPYRFKILGEGKLKATWTDAARHTHTVTGPQITEGEAGTLAVTLEPDGTARWAASLHR